MQENEDTDVLPVRKRGAAAVVINADDTINIAGLTTCLEVLYLLKGKTHFPLDAQKLYRETLTEVETFLKTWSHKYRSAGLSQIDA